MEEKNIVNAQTLIALRKTKGWSQLSLASKAQIDRSVISRLERNLQEDLKGSVLVAIARALETSVDSLLLRPPENRHEMYAGESDLVEDFEVLIRQIGKLEPTQQRHLAAVIRAYIEAL
jgi:transcriptional regulator with XRE-family HTH domain